VAIDEEIAVNDEGLAGNDKRITSGDEQMMGSDTKSVHSDKRFEKENRTVPLERSRKGLGSQASARSARAETVS
jgi:hypothetical protein